LLSFTYNIVMFIYLFLILIFLFSPKTAYASEEFYTSYNTTYTVTEQASVQVAQEITLKNRLADVYADKYQIVLNTTEISSIWANDSQGDILESVDKQTNQTSITLNFNKKVVGKDKALNFTIGYISDDYASKIGQVLEIGIPATETEQNTTNQSAVLKVPVFYKNPIFISPKPDQTVVENNYNVYKFTTPENNGQSITASFGENQIFEFTLNYFLENNQSSKIKTEIALPPDTSFQKMYYQKISPAPNNIDIDEDGNWLASYYLEPSSFREISAQGAVEIFIDPRQDFIAKEENLSKWLTSQKYWRTDNTVIKQTAQDLETPKQIYDFVVETLEYDYQRINGEIERLGAVSALENNNSALCGEFTDLFIALARASGIPSREVNGYAYTTNSKLKPLSLKEDILHAWPQYYDKQKNLWISVDPTWTDTTNGVDYFEKLDLNHFAFVFHGIESDYPHPAGAYKKENDTSKSIKIDFGSKPQQQIEYSLEIDLPNKIIAGRKIIGKIKVKNNGNTALINKPFQWQVNDLINKKGEIKIEILPPFSTFEKQMQFQQANLLTEGKIQVTTQFLDKQKAQTIEVDSPLIPYLFPYGLGGVAGLLIFMVLFKITKRRKN